jgi:hypothetical protein
VRILISEFGTNSPSRLVAQVVLIVHRSLGKATMPDNETARKISIDFTMAGARALTQQAAGHKIRFVYVSGFVTERDQSKSLWFMGEYRRIRVSLNVTVARPARS